MMEIEFTIPLLSNAPSISGYANRLSSLTGADIVVPVGFYAQHNTHSEFYAEAVMSYLFNLPSSSVALSTKCLELGMKSCLVLKGRTEVTHTSKKGKVRSKNIDKATFGGLISSDQFPSLGIDRSEADYLKGLRNDIHNRKIFHPADSLEVLRHVTRILNFLFPYSVGAYNRTCIDCRISFITQVPQNELLLGHSRRVYCPNSKRHWWDCHIGINIMK